MNTQTLYIVKVAAGISIFALPYFFLLRNDNHLNVKRFFLLFALVFSWLFPLLHFPGSSIVTMVRPSFMINLDPVSRMANSVPAFDHTSNAFSLWQLVFVLYLSGIILLIIRNLEVLRKWDRQGNHDPVDRGIVYTDRDQIFSLFRKIYLPEKYRGQKDIDTILIHERAHIRQMHFLDLLLLEITVLLTWFNPFTWLISRMIKENHEHLADREVLRQGIAPAHYSALLLNQSLGIRVFRLGHAFNHSLTKKRFDMMKNLNVSKSGMVKFIILVPAILLMFSFISGGKFQRGPVKGKVMFSGTNEAAIGAAVVIAGTTTGTLTDREGNFSLEVGHKTEIVISFVGYGTKTVNVSPGDFVEILLDRQGHEIDIQHVAEQTVIPHSPSGEAMKTPSADSGIFYVVEELPEFPGGTAALRDYVYSHLKYPVKAREKGLEGQAVVGFTVTTGGKVTDISVISASDPIFEKPAKEVFENMPLWKPGAQQGKSVKVNITVPIDFAIDRDRFLEK